MVVKCGLDRLVPWFVFVEEAHLFVVVIVTLVVGVIVLDRELVPLAKVLMVREVVHCLKG